MHTSTVYFIGPGGTEYYLATPIADHTSSSTTYLPVGQIAAWAAASRSWPRLSPHSRPGVGVRWLAGGQPLDDAEGEPVVLLDGERQGLHMSDWSAAEVLAAGRDAGQLDQRLGRADGPG